MFVQSIVASSFRLWTPIWPLNVRSDRSVGTRLGPTLVLLSPDLVLIRAVNGKSRLAKESPAPTPFDLKSPPVPNPPDVRPLDRSRCKSSRTGFAPIRVTLLAKPSVREFRPVESPVDSDCLKRGRISKLYRRIPGCMTDPANGSTNHSSVLDCREVELNLLPVRLPSNRKPRLVRFATSRGRPCPVAGSGTSAIATTSIQNAERMRPIAFESSRLPPPADDRAGTSRN